MRVKGLKMRSSIAGAYTAKGLMVDPGCLRVSPIVDL